MPKSFFLPFIVLGLLLNPTLSPNHAKNLTLDQFNPTSIILMIGDGMGWEQIELGRLVEYGVDGETVFTQFPSLVNISTDEINGQTTDSAASATAIATGVKTSNGRIAMNADGTQELETILEQAKSIGYKTGLITTVYIQHATPAAFAAHNIGRNNYVEIAEDMAENQVDILFGGGASDNNFGTQTQNLINNGYDYVESVDDLVNATQIPILGLFADGDLVDEFARTDLSTAPTLSQMTEKALELFGDEPFFLMVEGGKIDWAGHDNDPVFMVHEQIEFEKTVRLAMNYTEQQSDTLLLVTADHETGGLMIDDYNFSSPIVSKGDNLTTRIEKRNNRIAEINVSFSTTGHTNTPVILTGIGPGSELISNAAHHIDTYGIMALEILGEIPTQPSFTRTALSPTILSKSPNSDNGFVSIQFFNKLVLFALVVTLIKLKRNKI